MTDSISMDASELRALGADLTAAGSGIAARVRPVVVRGAVAIKNQMRSDMRASRHFKGGGGDIDFDVTAVELFGVGVIEAEIGPHTGPGNPGAIANIAYFGTSRGGGTVRDPQTALDAEAPRFEAALADLLDGLL